MEQTLLSIEHLKKSYDDNLILDDINLEVHQGEVIVLVGPSGCGKSTMLRCINALEPIQGGEIKLNGEKIDPKNKNIAELRQKIGMVFQSYELFPHLTVLDNILLAPMKVQKRKKEEAEKEAMALLERVGLAEKAKSYPRQLSGGQKQRVAIVRALCMHPEILLFDEVTAALDPENRQAPPARHCREVCRPYLQDLRRRRGPASGLSRPSGDRACAREALARDGRGALPEDGALLLGLPRPHAELPAARDE